MRLTSLLLLFTLASCQSSPLITTARTAEVEAHAAALTWLALIDAGDYQGSWGSADYFFQGQIAQEKWISRAGEVREPLGSVKVRSLSSVRYRSHYGHLLPKTESEQVVLLFKTIFEHDVVAREAVVQTKDSDGQWRVRSYYFVPQPSGCIETGSYEYMCRGRELIVGARPGEVRDIPPHNPAR
jgi:hypothetical protein